MLESMQQTDKFTTMFDTAQKVLEQQNLVGVEETFVDRIDDILVGGDEFMILDEDSISAALFDLDLEELAALEAIEVQMGYDAVMEAEQLTMENEILQNNLIASNSLTQENYDAMTDAEEMKAMFIAAAPEPLQL